jgi:replicative DNA helicase
MATVKQATIDLETMGGALELARDSTQKKIDIVFVDYLQRMPVKGGPDSKSVGVSDNLDGLKTIALRLRCPVVVGVQARREVDETTTHVPDLDDGQWTSNIEQTSDRVISLMRPAKYWSEGEATDKLESLRGKRVTKNMMLIYVAKQKLAKDNFSYLAFFDPEYNKLDELEMRTP